MGQGETMYVPAPVVPIVDALKQGDNAKAIRLINGLSRNI